MAYLAQVLRLQQIASFVLCQVLSRKFCKTLTLLHCICTLNLLVNKVWATLISLTQIFPLGQNNQCVYPYPVLVVYNTSYNRQVSFIIGKNVLVRYLESSGSNEHKSGKQKYC